MTLFNKPNNSPAANAAAFPPIPPSPASSMIEFPTSGAPKLKQNRKSRRSSRMRKSRRSQHKSNRKSRRIMYGGRRGLSAMAQAALAEKAALAGPGSFAGLSKSTLSARPPTS